MIRKNINKDENHTATSLTTGRQGIRQQKDCYFRMNYLFTLFIALLLGISYSYAQDSKNLESFKVNVFPQYISYFNQAELTENGRLNLSANGIYADLSFEEKRKIMGKINADWQYDIVIVKYGSKRELWGWSVATRTTQLLEYCDMNMPAFGAVPMLTRQKTALHPWFFYVGGVLYGDNQHNMNFSLDTRLGFFLLKDKWDFASTFSIGTTENTLIDGSSENWKTFGLMSRVYFPVKAAHISPNVGAEITFDKDGSRASLLIGLRWFVGIGSIDLGFRIGNDITTMGGYTVFPNAMNNK